MKKLMLTLFLIPIIASFYPISIPFGFMENSPQKTVMMTVFYILNFVGICIYIRLWTKKDDGSSTVGLWIAMILCFSVFTLYLKISDYNLKEKKKAYIEEHCTETVTTKEHSYTVKKCDDGTVNGEGYAVTEYMLEEGKY